MGKLTRDNPKGKVGKLIEPEGVLLDTVNIKKIYAWYDQYNINRDLNTRSQYGQIHINLNIEYTYTSMMHNWYSNYNINNDLTRSSLELSSN